MVTLLYAITILRGRSGRSTKYFSSELERERYISRVKLYNTHVYMRTEQDTRRGVIVDETGKVHRGNEKIMREIWSALK